MQFFICLFLEKIIILFLCQAAYHGCLGAQFDNGQHLEQAYFKPQRAHRSDPEKGNKISLASVGAWSPRP